MIRCASWSFTCYYVNGGPSFLNLRAVKRHISFAKIMATPGQACCTYEGQTERWKDRLSIKVGTFNILAPCYKAVKSREWKPFWDGKHESSHPDLYLTRYEEIFRSLSSLPVFDFMCLQEFWFNSEVAELFEKNIGDRYFIFKHKRPTKNDGVALLIKKQHRIIHVEYIKFNDIGMRVALLAHVVMSDTGKEVVLVTTHLTYLASSFDQCTRMTQAKKLGQRIDSYMASLGRNDVLLLLSGDFNSSPDGPIYKHFTDLGFISAYKTFNGCDPLVTHVDHNGGMVAADYIFYRAPEKLECKVVDAFLAPKDRSDKEWPDDFHASDHRPLFAEISLSER